MFRKNDNKKKFVHKLALKKEMALKIAEKF